MSRLLGLSLLEAAPMRAAGKRISAADFTATFDYIDSLASRRALTLGRRDIAYITTADLIALSPSVGRIKAVPGPIERSFYSSTDFRPLGDARRYHPEFTFRRPASLVRSSVDVVSPSYYPRIRNDFPPGWRNPLDPDRSTEDLNRTMREIERRALRNPWRNYFRNRSQAVICLKRQMRKQIMHASGFAGLTGFRAPKRNYWSRIYC